jgi:hypothetical protein
MFSDNISSGFAALLAGLMEALLQRADAACWPVALCCTHTMWVAVLFDVF